MAILSAAGVTWCERCADGGTVPVGDAWAPCPCPPLPSAYAEQITRRFGHLLEHAAYTLQAPGRHAQLETLIGRTPP